MNKYIIITNDIHMLGGGQLYTGAKSNYMLSKGFEVYVLYYEKNINSKIYVESLKLYKDFFYKWMQYPTYMYSFKKQNKYIQNLLEIINYNINDCVYIESNTVTASTWAEELAKATNGTHLAYILSERFSLNSSELSFFKYKYDQNKLFGTNKQSIKNMFGNLFDANKMEGRFLSAEYENNISGECIPFPFDVDSYDYRIGILSRLDKHFIIPTVKEVLEFASKYSDFRFVLVIIGGTDVKSELEPFERMFASCSNIDFYCTGPRYPIPVNWLTNMNVVIATAGSVWCSESANVPTISMCVQNDKPFGIFNYTTTSTRDADDNSDFTVSLSEYMKMVLFEGYCKENGKLLFLPTWKDFDYKKVENEYEKHIEIMMCKDNGYYNTRLIKKSSKEKLIIRLVQNYSFRMMFHRLKIILGK